MIQSQEGLWLGAGALTRPGSAQEASSEEEVQDSTCRRRRCPCSGAADSLTEVRESGRGGVGGGIPNKGSRPAVPKAGPGGLLGVVWSAQCSVPSSLREHSQAGPGHWACWGHIPVVQGLPQ